MSLQQLFGLDGRTALVTGGSSGIGRAIATALADAGAHVLVAARTAATIDATVAGIRQAGRSADGIVADLSSRAGAHALADSVGDVDVLVNSAGINLRPPMPELDEATWDATMAVNLDAPFVLGQRLAPGMAARGYGRIVSISSQQAHRPFAASGAYGVSKAGLEALARSQAEAWSAQGVTSNVLVPGFVRTPLNERLGSDPATVAALAARTLVGRNGLASDFAAAAVFLAGPGSAYVTGQSIAVDGGFSVH
ncbi:MULTISPECIES: SDR family NAD(P)-dependent oxidoreductase [Curtobacterium]|uniref:SDR family NAD(P)-dependent oxidoreductase n=1 Tax=Curtobacterium TaxID=2034 RepID=UPI00188BFE89|nr:SDR family oxidoreductase [Curtobacterium flaccumfaciens]MBF4626617.1 SDR family oxidoreductase [Curtobacterium flaccumfaciens]MBO9042846.1 SDR family oxidoreductase [Curtobacterium flaccumfaciens pv. flaccumfaciens]MCS6580316.1 SDR family oxidoreductase [Curtobacterium flaccumfaciens pv. beticola]